MALSRSARITLLLAIDILFFFIEIIVGMWQPPLGRLSLISLGYAVGSLALVADSFHMLKYVALPRSSPHSPSRSDVMSLIVALYAIRVCHTRVAFITTHLT
jgi:zinc transporter 1